MNNKITLKAHAKLNLLLNITGKYKDGYHELEMINTELELHDIIEIEELESIGMENIVIECDSSSINADIPEDESNLCYKAAKAIIDKAANDKGINIDKGIRIKIIKKIPVGGLGGGSSDCAAVLKGLNRLWDLGLSKAELIQLAAEISSDACFSVIGGTCIVRGKGEIIETLPNTTSILREMHVLLVKPDIGIPPNKTAKLYSKVDVNVSDFNKKAGTYFASMQSAIDDKDIDSIMQNSANVFEAFKFDGYEKVYALIENLKKWGCDNAILAGSGPMVVGFAADNRKLKNLLVILASNFYDFYITKIKTKLKEIGQTENIENKEIKNENLISK